MTVAPCTKCGEQRELVLVDRVCARCSDALDKQWADSMITDWVLITKDPNGAESGFGGIMKGISSPERFAEWLATPQRFLHRNIVYAGMKIRWALDNPTGSLTENYFELGPVIAEDVARTITPFIRPATHEEVAYHEQLLRKRRILNITTEIFNKWGLDDEDTPLDSRWDDDMVSQAFRGASEELTNKLDQLGLLEIGATVGQPRKQSAEFLAQVLRNNIGNNTEELKAHLATSLSSNSPIRPQRTNADRGLSKIAGMTDLKEQLTREVIGPVKDPELYRRYRVTIPNGILFYGPPGCGKTYIARNLADELGWHFQYCRPSDVASPYIHDTVSRIRAVFSTAIEKAPSIVFIDEFEAFVPARSQLGGHQQHKAEEVNEFLANLEGCAERKVLVIAATNEPEKIDPAVRRSGRFDKLILIPPPDAEARRAMLEYHLQDRPVDASLDTAGIATVLEGYAASDITLLVDEAARMALKRTERIGTSTLLAALERVGASITAEEMQRHYSFRSRGTG